MSPVSAWALVVEKRQQTCSAPPSHLFRLNEGTGFESVWDVHIFSCESCVFISFLKIQFCVARNLFLRSTFH